jgi:hypothetical protein
VCFGTCRPRLGLNTNSDKGKGTAIQDVENRLPQPGVAPGGLRHPVFHARGGPRAFVQPAPQVFGVTVKNHFTLSSKAVARTPERLDLELLGRR